MNATRLLSLLSLLAWGFLMLYIYYSGRITSFLHPTFRPWVLIAGWTLVILAVIYWFFSRRGSYADHEHEELVMAGPPAPDDTIPLSCSDPEHHHDHHDHDHHHHEDCCGHDHPPDHDHTEQPLTAPRLAGFIILMVPAISAAMISDDAFSLAVFENRLPLDTLAIPQLSAPGGGMIEDTQGFFENENILEYFDRSPDGNIKVDVVDLLYGSMDAFFRRDFTGQSIEIIGQALPQRAAAATRPDEALQPPAHDPNATDINAEAANTGALDDLGGVGSGDPEFLLGRMFMLCCAADARPVTIRIEYDSREPLPEAGWVRIVGEPVFTQKEGVWITTVRATSVTPTERPREIFLF